VFKRLFGGFQSRHVLIAAFLSLLLASVAVNVVVAAVEWHAGGPDDARRGSVPHREGGGEGNLPRSPHTGPDQRLHGEFDPCRSGRGRR